MLVISFPLAVPLLKDLYGQITRNSFPCFSAEPTVSLTGIQKFIQTMTMKSITTSSLKLSSNEAIAETSPKSQRLIFEIPVDQSRERSSEKVALLF